MYVIQGQRWEWPSHQGMPPGSFSNSVSLRVGEVAREADQGAAARSHPGTWCSRTDTRATAVTLRVQKPRLELELRRLGDDVQVGIRRSYLEGFG